ncbi:hypothetical protein PTKIN_Ptkin11bG0139400 [Pterospermum kingtungense]
MSESTSSLSKEEADILQRSMKRMKKNVVENDVSNEISMENIEDGQNSNHVVSQGLSFKDTLMGKASERLNLKDEGFISDDDDLCDEEEEEDSPNILSKKEKARLRRPWRQTLIIKLMGRSVGYTYLFNKIKAL